MIYSNDYSDYMINFLKESEKTANIEKGCINPITQKFAILHFPRTQKDFTNLETVPYASIPKLFGLMDSSNMEVIGVEQVQNEKKLGLTGKNVITGIIDTGIDYTNSLFLDRNTKSRIGEIWDQTISSNKKTTKYSVVNYGSVYSNEEINKALEKKDPYEVVPSKDENGHGTFMAGITAGGQNKENDFRGIANESEIVVVKLKEAKSYLKEYFGVCEDAICYAETDIIYAMDYLLNYAQKRKLPISILIGVGSSNGGHLGLTFLERYLSDILENAAIMVCVPAGNEGNQRLHYAGEMKEDVEYDEVEFNVDEGQDILAVEIWGDIPTTFALGIVSPQGDRIEKIPPRFGKEEVIRLPLADSSIYIAYQMIETYSGNELIFVRLSNPTPGIWKFLVYAEEGKSRTYNMWMPLRKFLRPETYFLIGESKNTITVPGNNNLVMTMTAYNHLNNSIYAEASRGYLSRNRGEPDLAAPGVNVMGPGLQNDFLRKTGTSVAAAHAAGVMALFLQWNIQNYDLGIFYAGQIQSVFLKAAIRNLQLEYPNIIWGYGVMNIEEVFNAFRIVQGKNRDIQEP